MGHVKNETVSQGRGAHDWDYVTFSEDRIVSALIRNRIKLDTTYGMKMFTSSSFTTAGPHIFCEPIICVYLDLDALIAECGLTPIQRQVVHLMMRGWSINDIADEYNTGYQTVDTHFRRAVKKIVKLNNDRHTAYFESIKGGGVRVTPPHGDGHLKNIFVNL